jgi:hypothetical protein
MYIVEAYPRVTPVGNQACYGTTNTSYTFQQGQQNSIASQS